MALDVVYGIQDVILVVHCTNHVGENLTCLVHGLICVVQNLVCAVSNQHQFYLLGIYIYQYIGYKNLHHYSHLDMEHVYL